MKNSSGLVTFPGNPKGQQVTGLFNSENFKFIPGHLLSLRIQRIFILDGSDKKLSPPNHIFFQISLPYSFETQKRRHLCSLILLGQLPLRTISHLPHDLNAEKGNRK